MAELLRPALLIALALLIPVLPALGLGDALDLRVMQWLEGNLSPSATAALVVGVLASDIFLPVPSSLVSTVGGMRLGFLPATAASWIGLTLGALLGFGCARAWGRPLAERIAGRDDLVRLDALAERLGPHLVVVTRALPVLAEASVLLLGATRMTWRRFLPAMLWSNLGIALAYSALGHFAWQADAVVIALVASIALPLAAATIARKLLPARLASEG